MELCLALKYWTRVEVIESDKHSSLLPFGDLYYYKHIIVVNDDTRGVIYDCNMFMLLATGVPL